ncbi:uncharacterized protein [Cherax quadricarinatus]|uniref:uncharacterized protein n=1 Tax=Cherax quadricarinatus TaxID=27406 RepID=UPI00387E8150
MAAVDAELQGYSLPTPSVPGFISGGSGFSVGSGLSGGSGFSGGSEFFGGSGFSGGSGFISGASGLSGGSGFISGGSGFSGSCGGGQIRHVDGSCITPQITKNLYVFTSPPVHRTIGPRPHIPPPRVEHNIIFIRTPEGGIGAEPIVVPPPQQKNIVYVLNKRTHQGQQVVHVPAPEQQTPQVYFVNYADGDNPTLPTGEDLQSALSSASHGGGEVIGAGGGIGGGAGIGIGGGSGIGIGGGTVGGFHDDSSFVSGGGLIGGGSTFVSGGGSVGVPTPSGLYGTP